MVTNTFINEEKIEQRFISFCKATLCNEIRNIHAEEKRWNEKYISIVELNNSQMSQLSTLDAYESECINFNTHGHIIKIEHALLAEAISYLPIKQQDAILLSFFLEQTDGEVASIMGIAQSTLHYHKTKALESLRQILEEAELKWKN